MEEKGWVSFYRKLLDNPTICKDSDYFAVWGYLLLNATHDALKILFKGEEKIIKPGQLITGRKKIAEKFNISESKVQRILKTFENEHQIEQEKSNKNRLITIVNWNMYQTSEQQNKQPMNNNRTTTEQPVNTNNNENNVIIYSPSLKEVLEYGLPITNNNGYCEKFYNHYESVGWVNGTGQKIQKWKLTFNNWVSKDFKNLPEWFNARIEKQKMNKSDEEDLKKMLKEFE